MSKPLGTSLIILFVILGDGDKKEVKTEGDAKPSDDKK